MTFDCPRCKQKDGLVVFIDHDGSNNIDGLGFWHLECKSCGLHTMKWKDEAKAREVYKGRPEYL